MINVSIRFYEELNDFIRADCRKKLIERQLNHCTTVKDLIESFGVPHTEVDLILVNGNSADFACRVNDGDIISVYPVFESFDISEVTRLQERPLRNLQFIADCHLGKLAGKMRLLGLDVEFRNAVSDDELVAAVVNDKKVLLSRDRRLLMRKVIDRGYLIRSQNPDEQVTEVIRRFDLSSQLHPFTRCARCNGILERAEKNAVLHLLEPKTRLYFEVFFQCQACQQVYWQGSHFSAIEEFIKRFTVKEL
ncbi:MAG: Mut7-C ubiquitin/RNAse domain-containing protein [Candidatus Riflebacteria bacterium]|nr:Mut7-C ubiquitin/RNAse domain-containing protein [Candidatus Riflebacteria bacterium]